MLSAAERLAPLEALTAWEDRRKRWRLKRLPAVLAIHSVDELAALQLAASGFERDGLSPQAERPSSAQLLPQARQAGLRPISRRSPKRRALRSDRAPRHSRSARRSSTRCAMRSRLAASGSGRTGYQTVHPYGFLYGSWHYLVAFSEAPRARDVRMFVLLNIIAATLLDEGFVPTAEFSLKAFAARSFGVFRRRP